MGTRGRRRSFRNGLVLFLPISSRRGEEVGRRFLEGTLSTRETDVDIFRSVLRIRVIVVAASLFTLGARFAPASPAAEPEADPVKAITLSFKMDPRLSGPTYGGERWLSEPKFTTSAQEGKVGTVDVKVDGVDADGRAVKVVPRWSASDPDMVTVTPGAKDQFRITVKPGESKLTVETQGISRELRIKAKALGNAVQVEILQDSAKKPPSAGPVTSTAEPDAPIQDDKSKRSYAVGLEMGKRLKAQFSELDPELISRGLKDALGGDKPLFAEEELKSALAAAQYDVQAKRVQAQKELAEKNKNDGETFLASNKAKEGVVTLDSGLQYKVLKAGEGHKPTLDDTVVCHYRGTLVDGTEFDSSYKRQRPATFALKRVIRGWRDALQLMPTGSKWQIFVPAGLAYGPKGARGTIGPNATLVFDVELLSIKDRPAATTPRPTSPQTLASDKSAK
jgi:FKBP-type peptidyl-prolyl cis-trans isomerase FklB